LHINQLLRMRARVRVHVVAADELTAQVVRRRPIIIITSSRSALHPKDDDHNNLLPTYAGVVVLS